jgi:hypothetical protein
MKTLILFLMFGFIFGCSEDQERSRFDAFTYDVYDKDSIDYPLFIDGGTKVVYQFGHLTADRGLKLYFDTIPYPAAGMKVDESVRRKISVE